MSDRDNAKCEICFKEDKYLMCAACFGKFNMLSAQLIKDINNNTIKLKDAIKQILKANKNKEKIAYDNYTKKANVEKLEELIRKKKRDNELLREKIGVMKREIINKRESVENMRKEIGDFNEVDCDIDIDAKDKMFIELKRNFAMKMFDLLLIKTNSLVKIDEFFKVNLSKKNKDRTILADSCSYSIIEQSSGIGKNLPLSENFNLKLLENQITCIKISQFFNSLIKFVSIVSEKCNIHLPHKINHNEIQSNKTTKSYQLIFNVSNEWLKDHNKMTNTLIAIFLLNTDYSILCKDIFQLISDDKKWFNLEHFVSKEQLISHSLFNDTLIKKDIEMEVGGFVVVNDYFI